MCCSVNAYQSTPDIPDIQDIQVLASFDEDDDDDPSVDDDALQAMVADMTFGADLSPL